MPLQWGLGQLTEESTELLTGMVRGVMLQWGLGQLTEESPFHLGNARRILLASMGPRSIDRGKLNAAVFGNGKHGLLQWGLGQLTEESARVARHCGPQG